MIELLQVNQLQIAYGQAEPVLRGLSFSVLPGEAVALVGPSGSGKSSCAAALLGLLNPRRTRIGGEARFQRRDGSPVELLGASGRTLRELRGREIGMIFQDPTAALNPVKTCGHQLRESIAALCPDVEDRDGYLHELLSQVELDTIAGRLFNSLPGQLSGGQLQRLLLAMALAGRPRLLIADEPTTALDSLTEAEVVRLLNRLRADHRMGLLFITHDRDLIDRVADRAVHLRPGAPLLTKGYCGGSAGEKRGGTAGAPAQTRISVEGLCIRFADAGPEDAVVSDCSFHLYGGEWLGLIGPSGCGKSTVAAWLSGLRKARAGTLSSAGRSIPADSAPAAIRELAGVQLIFQDVLGSLNPALSALRAVRESLPDGSRDTARSLLETAGLDPYTYGAKRPGELSGGERQRVAIARALAANPRVLVCDEALSGLDPPLRLEVLGVLQRICTERDIAVLFITHDLRLARRCVQRLLLMESGRIVERGTVEEVLTRPQSELGRRLVATLPSSKL